MWMWNRIYVLPDKCGVRWWFPMAEWERNDGWWSSPAATSCTFAVIILILACQMLIFTYRRRRLFFFFFRSNDLNTTPINHHHHQHPSRISDIVSDFDLQTLIGCLEEEDTDDSWECVIHRRNNSFSYTANCCKPKDGSPLKYMSTTVLERCSVEMLRDFYMDNSYRKEWDKTVIEHEQLQVDESNGTEIGRTIKKFPLLKPREYILAWRIWEGRGTYYCYSKECDHPLAPRRKKYVRIGFFRSGWRIKEVPGRNACEIKMFHQEDAGLNAEMAKLAFSKGIWTYVCKMDTALRKYPGVGRLQLSSAVSATTLVQKVPSKIESTSEMTNTVHRVAATTSVLPCQAAHESSNRKSLNKVIANSLILVGGVICLSRGGNSIFGAKIVTAYILSKLRKHRALSTQSRQDLVT